MDDVAISIMTSGPRESLVAVSPKPSRQCQEWQLSVIFSAGNTEAIMTMAGPGDEETRRGLAGAVHVDAAVACRLQMATWGSQSGRGGRGLGVQECVWTGGCSSASQQ